MRGEKKIGEIMVINDGRKRQYSINSVKGYGIVCPSLVTTNGAPGVLANVAASMVAEADMTAKEIGKPYEVRVFVKDREQTEMNGLVKALLEAHREAVAEMESNEQ